MKRRASILIVLAMLLPALSSCGFGSGQKTISARFADSSGLFVGNDVGILGVPVGKVTSIEPDGGSVIVKMSIKEDQRIPASAGAVVVARSVATDRYVEITPVYSSGPELQDGATINANRTRTPVDFDQVLSSLNSLATGLSGDENSKEAVARFLKMQSAALDGKGTMINKAIHEIAGATNAVSGQRQNITGTINSLDGLTKTLADNKSTINEFVRQVAAASSILAAERENFQTALRSISRMIAVVAHVRAAEPHGHRQGAEQLDQREQGPSRQEEGARRDPRGHAAGPAEPPAGRRTNPGCADGRASTRPFSSRSWRRDSPSSAARCIPANICELLGGNLPLGNLPLDQGGQQ